MPELDTPAFHAGRERGLTHGRDQHRGLSQHPNSTAYKSTMSMVCYFAGYECATAGFTTEKERGDFFVGFIDGLGEVRRAEVEAAVLASK